MKSLCAVLVAAMLVVIACAPASADPSTLSLQLFAQNRPGKTGTATLEQVPGGVKIVILMADGQNGAQPIHIHTGTCANLNPVPTYTLTNIINGSSTTTISDVTLDGLLKGNYVIDVHESSADPARYVACAAIATTK